MEEEGFSLVPKLRLGTRKDIDNFKIINDTFGHKARDYMIKYFVDNIKETIGPNDFLSRIGGDEFAIIIEAENNKKVLSKIAQKIIAAAAKKTYLKDQSIGVTCSIGISIYPDDAKYADELVEFADKAMCDVKVSGKHEYRFYRDVSR
jgi:diguanylate cyclase (GGDEF)-like protein